MWHPVSEDYLDCPLRRLTLRGFSMSVVHTAFFSLPWLQQERAIYSNEEQHARLLGSLSPASAARELSIPFSFVLDLG